MQRWCIWLVIGLSLIALACGGDDPTTPAVEDAANATPAEQNNDAVTAPPEQPSGRSRVRVVIEKPPARAGVVIDAADPAALVGGLDVARVSRSVVRVQTISGADVVSTGSGTIIDSAGLVLTSFQLIDPLGGYDQIVIEFFPSLDTSSPSSFVATLAAANPLLDLAVLRIVGGSGGNPIKPQAINLPALPLGDSDRVDPGTNLVALGFSDDLGGRLGLSSTRVSAFLNQIGVEAAPAWFETDVTLPASYAGGAIVNERGELVALPTLARPDGPAPLAQARPIALALPLIEAARRWQANSLRANPAFSASSSRASAPIFDLSFAVDLDRRGALADPALAFPGGSTDILYTFRFAGMSDDATWSERWRRDGSILADLSGTPQPWERGASGSFAAAIRDPGGFGDGVYTLEILLEGAVVASRSLLMGSVERANLSIEDARIFRDGEPSDGEVDLPVGVQRLVARFDYEDAEHASIFEAVWYRDDAEIARSGRLPWNGGASGGSWVNLSAARGAPPGLYRVDLLFDEELAGSASVQVSLGQVVTAIDQPLEVGERTSGALSQGQVALFRVSGLLAGLPLVVRLEGAGDPDLYVRRGEQPLEREFGAQRNEAGFIAPFLPGAAESVLVPRVEPGEEWFIAVLGMSERSAFQIIVEQPLQAYGAPALVPSQPVSGSLDAANPSARFVIDVPPDTSSLTVSMTANADVDLYLRPGLPVPSSAIGQQWAGGLLAPFALGGAESVPVVSPTAGPWYVEVVAFDASAEYTVSVAFDSVVVTAGPRPLASLADDSGILARNDTRNFTFDYSGNAALLAFSIGGRGDTDLYVKFAQAIEVAEIGRAWDSPAFQAPFLPASNETVYFIDPEAGRYFLTFAGADDFNSYGLVVYEFDSVPETLGLPPLLPGEPQTFVLRAGEAPTREIFVPAGTRRLDITLSGGGDADLVLRYLEPPDPAQYGAVALGPELWLPFAASSDERITITDPLPGVYVLAVVAFAELQTVEVITALE